MQGKTKTTFINQSELEQRLNNQIKPTSFRLISGLEYTVVTENLLFLCIINAHFAAYYLGE